MPDKNPLREVPPEQFLEARNALARQLRERGDPEGARRVAALRRPSAVLWILNQLGSRPKPVEDLIDATRRAGRAQMHGASGDELREAMREQKEAIQRLLAEAQETAAAAGLALTLEQQRRMKDTLQTAASSDPEALRAGSLEHELSPAGFNALLSGTGTAEVRAKAASHKRAFEGRVEEQKKRAAEARERQTRELEIRRAQQAAHRLSARATQLEKVAQRAMAEAEQARTRAEAARREADGAEAELLRLRTRS